MRWKGRSAPFGLTGTAVAAVCVVSAAMVVLSTRPAAADTSECTPSGCAGQAKLISYGEHLWVYDKAADGHSAVALYWLQGGTGPFRVWASAGAGTSIDDNLDLPEGTWIFYQVCLGESGSGTIVAGSCSAGVTDYA